MLSHEADYLDYRCWGLSSKFSPLVFEFRSGSVSQFDFRTGKLSVGVGV